MLPHRLAAPATGATPATSTVHECCQPLTTSAGTIRPIERCSAVSSLIMLPLAEEDQQDYIPLSLNLWGSVGHIVTWDIKTTLQ
ncbi:hypothetical protein HYPSUDRAFT_209809 [Hypholoma sublateritium FD-334 SS-4]|uniref:Uncharacterized protein n=1 Tax=Hypholoma sublateritium (strain FD-334 SS-4) TaxID=945553 RepID=A0A0D2N1N7_HYPSF|nr:hypothetical protein HYPSUDRAFT_209809 [Hypholoma sublateritium FD-334 SS-4]